MIGCPEIPKSWANLNKINEIMFPIGRKRESRFTYSWESSNRLSSTLDQITQMNTILDADDIRTELLGRPLNLVLEHSHRICRVDAVVEAFVGTAVLRSQRASSDPDGPLAVARVVSERRRAYLRRAAPDRSVHLFSRLFVAGSYSQLRAGRIRVGRMPVLFARFFIQTSLLSCLCSCSCCVYS